MPDRRRKEDSLEIMRMFGAAAGEMAISGERREKALSRIAEEIEMTDVSYFSSAYRPASALELWRGRLKCLDKGAAAGFCEACLAEFIVVLYMLHQGMWWEDMAIALGFMSVFLGMAAILGVNRFFYAGMGELGESCFYNGRQLAAMHMVLYGIFHVAVSLLTGALLCRTFGMGFFRVMLYVLTPLLTSLCVYMAVLMTERGRRRQYPMFAASLFLAAGFAVIASRPDIYQAAMVSVWIYALVCSAVLFGAEAGILWKRMKKKEALV